MTIEHSHPRRRWKGLSLGMALAALIVAFIIAWPAHAYAAQSVAVCNPTATVGCINGILQNIQRKPIAGATVTLDGKESASATTDAEGKWAFSVSSDGSYTVSLDPSLVSKYQLKSSKATVEIKKGDFTKSRQVVRFDEIQADSTPAPKSSDGASSSVAQDSADSSSQHFGTRVWQQLYSGIIFGLMLGLMSVGMNLVYGTTGLSSFSHGEQVTLGGLMAYVGAQLLHWPLVVSALFAVIVGALSGWVQNDLVWAPLRRKRVGPMQQMIVTIGLSMALQYVYQFFFGGNVNSITISVPPSITIGPITTDAPTLVSALIAIVVILAITFFLYRTRLGRATRAVSDNSSLAAASGINVEQVVRVVWILSTGLAALSGVLMALYLNGVAWNTGALMLLLMFSAVTLGGLGTANGALVGSLIIGIVADTSSLFIPNDMRYASALAILIIVLLVRPQGLFGKLQRVG